MNVKLPVYEGSLELLLDLIKKGEMDIYDIPIAEITRQYLEYLDEMKELNLEIAGEYLVMAATLLFIKSQMLLPGEGGEEEDLEQDPRQELVRKLIEYQTFREIAKELGWLATERSKVFTREIAEHYLESIRGNESDGNGHDGNSTDGSGRDGNGFDGNGDGILEGFGNDVYALIGAFQKVLRSVAQEKPHVVGEVVVPIEEKIEELKRILTEKGEIHFEVLMVQQPSRLSLIVAFLAVLEMVRQRFVRIFQEKPFGSILICLN